LILTGNAASTIVDFYCKDLMLAIEIDGISHNYEEAFNKDILRQEKLEGFGIYFLRFSEAEMKNDMMNVIRTIENTVINIIKNTPLLQLPKGFDLNLLKD